MDQGSPSRLPRPTRVPAQQPQITDAIYDSGENDNRALPPGGAPLYCITTFLIDI
jgi:hypothetical protein